MVPRFDRNERFIERLSEKKWRWGVYKKLLGTTVNHMSEVKRGKGGSTRGREQGPSSKLEKSSGGTQLGAMGLYIG